MIVRKGTVLWYISGAFICYGCWVGLACAPASQQGWDTSWGKKKMPIQRNGRHASARTGPARTSRSWGDSFRRAGETDHIRQDSQPSDTPASATRHRSGALKAGAVLAVMDIEDTSGSVDKKWLDNAGEMLRGKLSATGYFVVIDKSRQQAKLKQLVRDQKKESYMACYDQQCQVPLGQALAADSILRTTISCLGDACMLSSELVDLEKEAAVSGGTADFDNSASELKRAIDSVVEQLKQNYR